MRDSQEQHSIKGLELHVSVKIFRVYLFWRLFVSIIVSKQVNIPGFKYTLLPARASEQGNVIGSVRIYIYIIMCTKKNCN